MQEVADDPSARIVRIEAPVASPGQCGICGNNECSKGFADARLDFEWYGTFYLCGSCVGDYARLFGFMSPEDLESFRTQFAAQAEELRILRQAILSLESTVDSLSAANASYREHRNLRYRVDAGLTSEIPSTPNGSSGEATNPTEPVSNSSDGRVSNGSSEPSEPTNQSSDESGPDDLYDTSTANNLLGL